MHLHLFLQVCLPFINSQVRRPLNIRGHFGSTVTVIREHQGTSILAEPHLVRQSAAKGLYLLVLSIVNHLSICHLTWLVRHRQAIACAAKSFVASHDYDVVGA